MSFKVRFIVAVLAIAGCYALPTSDTKEIDTSYFLSHQVDPESRVVGGTIAPEGTVPYMVALTNGLIIRSFLCGGSVISQRHVLTAAHCIDAVFSWGSLSSSLRGTVGTNRWNIGGTTLSFSSNITHQHYVSSTIKNDVGVLITSSNIAFTNLVQPIPLSYDNIGAGVVTRVTGWGRIVAGGALSAQLLELFLVTLSGDTCIAEMNRHAISVNVNPPPVEPHIEICTFHSIDHGTCNGDSGSALVAVHTGQQVGVVSWGFPCARGAPDVFARVSGFADWFQAILG